MFRRFKEGDVYTLLSGGGGGYGLPVERNPESVAQDVRQGYVSEKLAREAYGVALTADGMLDLAETQRLRRTMSTATAK
jgi:N-methylhydantoinase B